MQLDFDLLNGTILRAVDGNCLLVQKDGSCIEWYVHEDKGFLYLSENPDGPNEEVYAFDWLTKKQIPPMRDFVGKEITAESLSYLSFEGQRRLPTLLKLTAKDSQYAYEMIGKDGLIVVKRRMSNIHLLSRLNKLVGENGKTFDEMTEDDFRELKMIEKYFPGTIFEKGKLRVVSPRAYSELYEPENKPYVGVSLLGLFPSE